jgi:hypothetical protein
VGGSNKCRRKLGGGRQISNASEHSSSLSGSYQSRGGHENDDDDESSEDPRRNGYRREKISAKEPSTSVNCSSCIFFLKVGLHIHSV